MITKSKTERGTDMKQNPENSKLAYAIIKDKIVYVKTCVNKEDVREEHRQDAMIGVWDNKNSCIFVPLKDVFDDYNTAVEELKLRKIQKQNERPSWDAYFMNIAIAVSTRSSCTRRKVGAIIVKDKRIITTGYNGTPRGLKNCDNGGCPRCNSDAPSGTKLDECLCSHAEENAIVQAAYHGVSIKGGVLYVTFTPCLHCAKMICNSGIREVVYNEHYTVDAKASEILQEAGIILRRVM